MEDYGISKDKLIIIPTPPKRNMKQQEKDRTRTFYDVAVTMSNELGCDCLTFWDDFLNKPDLFSDFVHFSAKGSRVLFDHLMPKMKKNLSEEKLRHFPPWRKML